MLRYDPTKEDHTKYLANNKRKLGNEQNEQTLLKKSKRNQEDADDTTGPVSKEQFYSVSTQLTASLRNPVSNGFSLLNMFGSGSVEVNTQPTCKEKLLNHSAHKLQPDLNNPFTFDSSDDDEYDRKSNQKTSVAKTNSKQPNPSSSKNKAGNNKQLPNNNKKNSKIWHERFFMADENDARIKGNLIYLQ